MVATKREVEQLRHGEVLAGLIGGAVAEAVAILSLVGLILVWAPLHLHVGIAHTWFALLWLVIPVPVGVVIGWWQHDRMIGLAADYMNRSMRRIERATGR